MAVAIPATEQAELAAFTDLFAAAEPEPAATLGVAALRAGGAFAFSCTALPTIELNRAVGVTTVDELDEVERFLRERDAAFWISLPPGAGLESELERRGYVSGYPWMKFSRRTDSPAAPETELAIAEVGRDRALDFAQTFVGGYGLPVDVTPWLARLPGREGWTCVVAYDGDRPLGGGALYTDGDVGWLGMAATLPEARGRGSQTAILAHRIAIAAAQGCSLVVTETGERVDSRPSGSYRNILRAGFEERYLRPNYRAPSGR